MKKIFFFKVGGLQQKIINLVLVLLIILVGFGLAVAAFKASKLSQVVSEAREEQQASIEKTSAQTMYQVTESSMTKTNSSRMQQMRCSARYRIISRRCNRTHRPCLSKRTP